MKTTVDTWLPIFNGFYGTIWETNGAEEREMDWINEQRQENGLPDVTWDDIEWDYTGYELDVSQRFTKQIESMLITDGYIAEMKFQEIRSPREYNFANDSVNVAVTLTDKNVIRIEAYLTVHKLKFTEHIKDRYTSCDGFSSSYSNNVETWIGDYLGGTLSNGHQLGAVLQFILLNENEELEGDIHEDLTDNGVTLQAKNYDKLVPSKGVK